MSQKVKKRVTNYIILCHVNQHNLYCVLNFELAGKIWSDHARLWEWSIKDIVIN